MRSVGELGGCGEWQVGGLGEWVRWVGLVESHLLSRRVHILEDKVATCRAITRIAFQQRLRQSVFTYAHCHVGASGGEWVKWMGVGMR